MHSKWLGLVAGLTGFSAFAPGSAAADPIAAPPCSTHDDCPAGYWCGGAASGGGTNAGDPGAAPAPQPDCAPNTDCGADAVAPEERLPAPVSICTLVPEGTCESDADCASGLTCAKGESSKDCAVSSNGETSCGETSEPSRFGYCEVPEILCEADADCPNGLSCVASGGSVSQGPCSPEGCPETVVTAGEKTCTFAPKECDANADCASGYTCFISTVTVCSGSSGGATEPSPACAGGDCAVAEEREAAASAESSCTEEKTDGYCFPEKKLCTSDAECGFEGVCFEYAEAQAPDFYDESGVFKSCLPEGIALVAQASHGRGGFASDSLGTPQEDDAKGEDGDEESAPQAGGVGGPKNGDGSACSVSPTQAGPAWLLAALTLLSGALLRRRQRLPASIRAR